MQNSLFHSLFLAYIMLIIPSSGYSQEVDFKKDKIIINGKEAFTITKKAFGTEISIFSLEPKSEIIYGLRNDNGTAGYLDDDFLKISFLDFKITIESTMLAKRTWKYIVSMLVESNVIDESNKINEENLRKFEQKYNENITNRTIITK